MNEQIEKQKQRVEEIQFVFNSDRWNNNHENVEESGLLLIKAFTELVKLQIENHHN